MASSREVILDGAFHVMQTRGLARTTTKEIAKAAGFSEPMLYRFFDDKIDLFLAVLAERLPRVVVLRDGGSDLVGEGSLAGNLRVIVAEMTVFYRTVLPIGMSIFSDTELLERHREAVHERGTGPEIIVDGVKAYLETERAAGRVGSSAPIGGAAMALVGACQHEAFLWCFNGETKDGVDAFAADVVAAILPSLTPEP